MRLLRGRLLLAASVVLLCGFVVGCSAFIMGRSAIDYELEQIATEYGFVINTNKFGSRGDNPFRYMSDARRERFAQALNHSDCDETIDLDKISSINERWILTTDASEMRLVGLYSGRTLLGVVVQTNDGRVLNLGEAAMLNNLASSVDEAVPMERLDDGTGLFTEFSEEEIEAIRNNPRTAVDLAITEATKDLIRTIGLTEDEVKYAALRYVIAVILEDHDETRRLARQPVHWIPDFDFEQMKADITFRDDLNRARIRSITEVIVNGGTYFPQNRLRLEFPDFDNITLVEVTTYCEDRPNHFYTSSLFLGQDKDGEWKVLIPSYF